MLTGRIGLPGDIAVEVVSFLRRVAAAADSSEIEVRDPEDTGFLTEAIAGRSAALATGDRDLLELAVHTGVTALQPRGIRERLAGR